MTERNDEPNENTPGEDEEFSSSARKRGRKDLEQEKGEKEMTFLDHLEELRWRIIYSAIGIAVGAIGVWVFKDYVIEDFLIKPAIDNGITLQNLRPFGQVFLYMQVAIFGGLILSIPNVLYQVWKFVSPGLYPHERRYIAAIVVFSSLCFLTGVAFAYFFIMPSAFAFFMSFGTSQIENNISIEEYFNFILNLMLGAGLVFELPMLSLFLSKLGMLTPKFMRKYWRHAIVIIFIAAALLTPGADPVSMVMLAIPLMGLYEISIWISKFSQKKSAEN